MSQPSVILQTPSGATVELTAHKIGSIRYRAKVLINNTAVVYAHATHTIELDGNDVILNETHIRLLPESLPAVITFLRETKRYAAGGES